jgi:hypothetical protein
MMFAHAKFERRVSKLIDVISREPGFGEQPKNRWTAKSRPEKIKRLSSENACKNHFPANRNSEI